MYLVKLGFQDRRRNFAKENWRYREGKLKYRYLQNPPTCRDKSSNSIGLAARTMRNVCVYGLFEFISVALALILSGLRHKFTRRGNRRRRWVLQPARGAIPASDAIAAMATWVTHVALLHFLWYCVERAGNTCARAKLRNYRRVCYWEGTPRLYTRARKGARKRKKERRGVGEEIESDQPGKWRVKLQRR